MKEFKDDFTNVRFDYGRVQDQTSILDIIKIPERRLNLKVRVIYTVLNYLFFFTILDKLNICLELLIQTHLFFFFASNYLFKNK
jgi:hypothetical protein